MSQERSLERWVLLQDVGVVLASLWLAHVLRSGMEAAVPVFKPTVPLLLYGPLLLAFLPTWVWCAERLQLNSVRTLTGPPLDLARALIWTQGWGALAVALLLTVTQTPLNRSLIVLFFVVSTILLAAIKRAQRAWVIRERGESLALLLGAADQAVRDIESLRGRAVERLADPTPDALRARLRAGAVDEVVIAGMAPESTRGLVETCDEVGLPALVRLDDGGLTHFPPQVEVVGSGIYMRYLRRDPDPGLMLVKGLIDRLLAGAALVVTLPLALAVALAIKAGSRGPVLFIQRRGGLHGRPFPMLKFRTMREGAEAEREALLAANEMDGPVFKIRNDPAHHRRRTLAATDEPRRAAAARERPPRPHEPGGPTAAAGRGDARPDRSAPEASQREARADVSLAGPGPQRPYPFRNGWPWTSSTSTTGAWGSTSSSCCARCPRC